MLTLSKSWGLLGHGGFTVLKAPFEGIFKLRSDVCVCYLVIQKYETFALKKTLPNFGYDVGFTGTGSFKNKCHISSQNQKKCLDFYIDNKNNIIFNCFQHW